VTFLLVAEDGREALRRAQAVLFDLSCPVVITANRVR
jgi:hypothetical protein